MLGEMFTPVETPEAPNRGFFKGLFGGGAQSLDREDLCEFFMYFVNWEIEGKNELMSVTEGWTADDEQLIVVMSFITVTKYW